MQVNKNQSLFRILYLFFIIIILNSCGTSDSNIVKDYNNNINKIKLIIHDDKIIVGEIKDLSTAIVRKMEKQQIDDEFRIMLKQLFHLRGVYFEKAVKWQEELNRIKAFVEINEYRLKEARIDTESAVYTISRALIHIRDFEKYLKDLKFN